MGTISKNSLVNPATSKSDIVAVIGRNLSTGTEIAKPGAMQDAKTVRLVKQYARPDFRTTPTPDDRAAKDKLELKLLRMDVQALQDEKRRLREEIEDTIKMLTQALEENKEETAEQVRRRISRLRGSLEYRGRVDFVTKER